MRAEYWHIRAAYLRSIALFPVWKDLETDARLDISVSTRLSICCLRVTRASKVMTKIII